MDASPSLPTADRDAFGAHRAQGLLATLIGCTRSMPDTWLGHRLAFGLRRAALNMIRGPVDAEALGARFRLHPFDNVCEKRLLFTPQFFDPEERAILAERIGEGFVFVDIGANIGAYSLFVAARAGAGARVLAIEPQPVIFERLVRNIRENQVGTVKAIACAIADRDGEVTLFIDSRNRGESGLKYVRPEGRAGGEALVPARTLLTLLREENLDRIDALKVDVGGAEDLILEPFFRAAPARLWPRLVILDNATSRWQVDLPALLALQGYEITARTKLNLVLERRSGVL